MNDYIILNAGERILLNDDYDLVFDSQNRNWNIHDWSRVGSISIDYDTADEALEAYQNNSITWDAKSKKQYLGYESEE